MVLDRDGDVRNTGTGTGKPAQDLSVNFVPVPYPDYPLAVIPMKPGERQLWRVLNASAITYLNLATVLNGKRKRSAGRARWRADQREGSRRNGAVLAEPPRGSAGRARMEFVVTGPAEGVNAS